MKHSIWSRYQQNATRRKARGGLWGYRSDGRGTALRKLLAHEQSANVTGHRVEPARSDHDDLASLRLLVELQLDRLEELGLPADVHVVCARLDTRGDHLTPREPELTAVEESERGAGRWRHAGRYRAHTVDDNCGLPCHCHQRLVIVDICNENRPVDTDLLRNTYSNKAGQQRGLGAAAARAPHLAGRPGSAQQCRRSATRRSATSRTRRRAAL